MNELVETIGGLYDGEETWGSFHSHKNLSLPCLFGKHNWIDARFDEEETVRPGVCGSILGGLVRFCADCKTIMCRHEITSHYYEVRENTFFSVVYKVNVCSKCGRRILVQSYGCPTSSKEARELIAKVTKEMGLSTNFGFDFATIVSQKLDVGKDAEGYIRNALIAQRFDIKSMKT